MRSETVKAADQCPDVFKVWLCKVGNDIVQVLKAEGVTAMYLDGERGAQLEVPPHSSSLLASLPDVLVQQ